MRIVYWSDFNCPFCYIGNVRLKKAVEELGLDVEWERKAFELEPYATGEVTSTTLERFAEKYELSLSDAKKQIDEIGELAKEEGLDFHYENAKLTSSRDAHRLMKMVQSRYPEKEDDLAEKIFKAYFCENKKISDHDTLIEIAKTLKIDENEVKDVLDSDLFNIEIDLDIEDARMNSIRAVPYYGLILNSKKLIIPGAITKEAFKIALEDLINDELDAKSCGIGIC